MADLEAPMLLLLISGVFMRSSVLLVLCIPIDCFYQQPVFTGIRTYTGKCLRDNPHRQAVPTTLGQIYS